MYNQYNKNNDDLLTWSKFRQEMNYYIPIGAILVELQDCPNTKEKHEGELALVVVLQ